MSTVQGGLGPGVAILGLRDGACLRTEPALENKARAEKETRSWSHHLSPGVSLA